MKKTIMMLLVISMIACSKSNQTPGGATIPPPTQKTFDVSLKASMPICDPATYCVFNIAPNPGSDSSPFGPYIILTSKITNLSTGVTISKYSFEHVDSTYTNVIDNYFVEFPYPIYNSNGGLIDMQKSDSLVASLITLQAGNTYYFKVIVTDNLGNSQIANQSIVAGGN